MESGRLDYVVWNWRWSRSRTASVAAVAEKLVAINAATPSA